MTEQEQLEWLALLGKTRQQQVTVLRDLLFHARGDEMSAADREICIRQFERLTGSRFSARWRV